MTPFSSLTYQGQVRRLRRLAESTLPQYGLTADNCRLTPLQHAENATFRIDSQENGRSYCLRIHRPDYQTPEAIRSELLLLAQLGEAGFRVPIPVATREGEWVATAHASGVPDVRCVTLLGWVNGRFLRGQPPESAWVETSAALLARLHTFWQSVALPIGVVRPRLDDEPFLQRSLAQSFAEMGASLSGKARGVIEQGVEKASAVREQLGEGPSVFGLIHGDFHRGNLLLGARGEIRVIDFDDCGWAHYLTDIANATEGYLRQPDGEELRRAFLRGYRTVRDLSAEHEALLPVFTFTRSLIAIRWMAARQDNPRLRAYLPGHIEDCVRYAQPLRAQTDLLSGGGSHAGRLDLGALAVDQVPNGDERGD